MLSQVNNRRTILVNSTGYLSPRESQQYILQEYIFFIDMYSQKLSKICLGEYNLKIIESLRLYKCPLIVIVADMWVGLVWYLPNDKRQFVSIFFFFFFFWSLNKKKFQRRRLQGREIWLISTMSRKRIDNNWQLQQQLHASWQFDMPIIYSLEFLYIVHYQHPLDYWHSSLVSLSVEEGKILSKRKRIYFYQQNIDN